MIRVVIIAILTIWSTLPFLAQNYHHNFDQSLTIANQEDKDVLMVFSGSDWCKPCIKLRKSILDSDEFQTFQSDNLVLLELDFPYSKKNKQSKEQKAHNAALADQYNSEGSFPKMVLLSKEKEVIGEVVYNKTATTKSIIDQIDQLLK